MDTREKISKRYARLKETLSPEAIALIEDLLQRDLMADSLIDELLMCLEEEAKKTANARKSYFDLLDRA